MFDMSAFVDRYATLLEMQDWANDVMASRPPDFRIGPGYIDRWFLIPRNSAANIYLHRTLRSDDDRALHDHPWDNTSLVIAGGYIEVLPTGHEIKREPGDIIQRTATDRHRLVLEPGYQSISLFVTGPKVREWGFWCDEGKRWVHWRDFTAGDGHDKGIIGRGCGEP